MLTFRGALVVFGLVVAGCGARSNPVGGEDGGVEDDSGADGDRDTGGDGDLGDGDEACLDEELCDGVDNNCDGQIDEGCPQECPPGVEIPTDEVCDDGIDNDCDGLIDEVDCPSPPSCICLPGSRRWCDDPATGRISWQACAESGREWGPCSGDDRLSDVCSEVEGWYSPRFEQCLIEHGECVQDMWDLDHDGDTWESLGACPQPVCP